MVETRVVAGRVAPWDPTDYTLLEELVADDTLSIKEYANRMGRSEGAVGDKLRDLKKSRDPTN
jgi:predicted transcriptional regulator